MYLSSLMIDVGENPDRPRPGRLWLRNLYRVHQRLCMAFPSTSRMSEDRDFLRPFKPEHFGVHQVHTLRGEDNGFLFRVDPLLGPRAMILVQSAVEPNWDYAFHNADYLLGATPEIRPYHPHFQNGQLLTFRLLTNATCKKDKENRPQGKNNYGRRVPVPRDEIEVWLTGRAERYGFKVEGFSNVQMGYVAAFRGKDNDSETDVQDDGGKEKRLKRFFYARYEGRLRVTAPDFLRNAIMQGIGPGKAFGFGLLSVRPAEGGST